MATQVDLHLLWAADDTLQMSSVERHIPDIDGIRPKLLEGHQNILDAARIVRTL